MAAPGLLANNLMSPISLSFLLGFIARLARSELHLPKDVTAVVGVYLLFALGLKGGVELAHASMQQIAAPIGATLLVGIITPLTAYGVLRWAKFRPVDAAGIAAHYGSVSAVTYIAAQTFVAERGLTVEGFMPTLLTILESPGIHIALAIGALTSGTAGRSIFSVLHEVLTARSMVLLVGGLAVGFTTGDQNWQTVEKFYDPSGPIFRGALCLYLLGMGITAGSKIGELRSVGPFLLAFAIVVPIFHGALGVVLGWWAGLSLGGATVLAAMAASASYIAAPPAVQATLPDANPAYSLTCSLAITFPFNVLVGIPLYYQMARWLY